jgi:hypothetical protein
VNPPESIRRTFFHTQLDSVISAARLRRPAGAFPAAIAPVRLS